MAYNSDRLPPSYHHYLTWHGPVYTNTYTNAKTYSSAYMSTDTDASSSDPYYNTWHRLNWLPQGRSNSRQLPFSPIVTSSLFNSPSTSPGQGSCKSPVEIENPVEGRGEGDNKDHDPYNHGGKLTSQMGPVKTRSGSFNRREVARDRPVLHDEQLPLKRSTSGRSTSGVVAMAAGMFCCWMPSDDDIR